MSEWQVIGRMKRGERILDVWANEAGREQERQAMLDLLLYGQAAVEPDPRNYLIAPFRPRLP